MGKKIRKNSDKIKPVSKTIKVSDFLKTGIYFLIKDKQIVYIGTTSRFPIRFGSHILAKDFDSFRFIEYPSDKCYGMEARLINYFRPKYNINGIRPTDKIYDFPKKKGDWLTAPIYARYIFYNHARRGRYKIRTWRDEVCNQLIVERT